MAHICQYGMVMTANKDLHKSLHSTHFPLPIRHRVQRYQPMNTLHDARVTVEFIGELLLCLPDDFADGQSAIDAL